MNWVNVFIILWKIILVGSKPGWRKPLQPEDLKLLYWWRITERISKAVSKTAWSWNVRMEWSCEMQSNFAASRIFTPLVGANENDASDQPPHILFHSTPFLNELPSSQNNSFLPKCLVENPSQSWIKLCVYEQLQRGLFCWLGDIFL